MFAGRQLADDCCLAHCGVGEEATLNVLGRLLGGAKKRKKKTYTKPKKIKHKHKKIKLRVLQFYKVRMPGLACLSGRSLGASCICDRCPLSCPSQCRHVAVSTVAVGEPVAMHPPVALCQGGAVGVGFR